MLKTAAIAKTATIASLLTLSVLSAFAQQRVRYREPDFTGAPQVGGYGSAIKGFDGHQHQGRGSGDANILIPYAQPDLVPQSMGMGTSAATYSNGRMVAGAVRTPQGVVHLSNGLVVGPGHVVGPIGVNFGVPAAPGIYHGYSRPGWGPPVGMPGMTPEMAFPSAAGQLLPHDAAYPYGLPYSGGPNAWYPGSVLGSTLLNMSYSMRPSVPSTAVYSGPGPIIIQGTQFGAFPDALSGPQIPDVPPAPAPDIQSPLLNEFEAYPRSPSVSSLPDRINSLRYQSVGDEAFRNEDYVKAAEAYRAGLDLASDRPGLWIRMAFANIACENFPEAVRCLKTALLTPPDATRTWVTADELYGQRAGERARTHGGELWNWLAERPLSSDRLLLGGAFQKLRGFDGAAAELLQMASYEGAEADYVAVLMSLAEGDIGQRPVSQQLGQMIDASNRSKSAAVVVQPRVAKPLGEALLPSSPDGADILPHGSESSPGANDDSTMDTLEPQSLPLFIPKL